MKKTFAEYFKRTSELFNSLRKDLETYSQYGQPISSDSVEYVRSKLADINEEFESNPDIKLLPLDVVERYVKAERVEIEEPSYNSYEEDYETSYEEPSSYEE